MPYLYKVILQTILSLAFLSCSDELDLRNLSDERVLYSTTINFNWDNSTSRSYENDGVELSIIHAQCPTFANDLYAHVTTTTMKDDLSLNYNNCLSRGTMTYREEDGSFDMSKYKAMGIVAYAYDRNEEFPINSIPNYIENDKVPLNSSKIISERYWPKEDCNVRFFAYAPFDDILLDSPVQGYPSFTYTVSKDIKKQKDILVAPAKDVLSSIRKPVDISFNHALASVTIIATPDFASTPNSSVKIYSISLNNIYGTGSLTWTDKRFEWNNQSNSMSFTYDFEGGLHLGSHENEIVLNPDNEELTLLMIPQILSEDSYLEISFMDDLTETKHTSRISLKGQKWEAGRNIKYKLSTNNEFIVPVFSLTLNENDGAYNEDVSEEEQVSVNDYKYLEICNHLGQWGDKNQYVNRDFTVESYAKIATSQRDGSVSIDEIPLDWDYEINYEGDYIGWITFQDLNTSSDSRKKNYRLAVTPQSQRPNVSQIQSRHQRSIKGSVESPHDLSTSGGTELRTTANCYIVNEPGFYSFPLVYGNAVKREIEYSLSYVPSADLNLYPGHNMLPRLVNYSGAPITSPYIFEDKDINGQLISIGSAELLWEDENGMIQNVTLDDNKQNIIFEIPSNFDRQGNGIIILRDNTPAQNIIWSWHIWVTDYNPYINISTSNALINDNKFAVNESYYFMTVPIGWCNGKEVVYDKRDATVVFNQKKDATIIQDFNLKLRSAGLRDVTPGNNTLYQFGRKDPMPGVVYDKYNKSIQKTIFGTQVELINISTSPDNRMTISQAISNPNKFYYGNVSFTWVYGNVMPSNVWAINSPYVGLSVTTLSKKTIYDPSPRGYKLPDNRIFYNTFTRYKTSVNWTINNSFASTSDLTLPSFPLSGIFDDRYGQFLRITDDNKGDYYAGRFWTARCQSQAKSSHVCIKYYVDNNNQSQIIFHADNCSHCAGMSIIPMKDDDLLE